MTDEIENEIIEEVEQEVEQPKPEVKHGHMTKEEWEASGKDPADWLSEDAYKERGQRIASENKLRKEFERRLESMAKLHAAQLQQTRNELLIKRDNAIDVADRAEVHRIDKQLQSVNENIDELKLTPSKPPEVQEWEDENPWIFDDSDPRTPAATRAFSEAQAAGKSLALCIAAAERAAAKVESIPRRTPIASADIPKSRANPKEPIKLSVKDLTKEEMQFRSYFQSESEFLQAVADDRRSRRK